MGMRHETPPPNGADALARMIRLWSAAPAFHVPGEGILELLDALDQQDHPLVSCRHEAGAAVAAQAAGHVTGRPGICLVGRAPGALNTALALHTASTDGAPLILIVGQPPVAIAGREPFLANDFAQAFAPMAKWVGTCTSAAQLPELMTRAWGQAMTGRRGPVVLTVHEEVWSMPLDPGAVPQAPPAVAAPAPDMDALAGIARALAGAQRPLILAGGTGWSGESAALLRRFAEATGIPVATGYRRRDLMPGSHPLFAGELGIGMDPALAAGVAQADLLLVLGMRLGEINTFGGPAFEGYRLLQAPRPSQCLLHVHPDPGELNAVYRCDTALCAVPEQALAGLLAADLPQSPDSAWQQGLRQARRAFVTGRPCPGPVDLRAVCHALRAALPADTMFTVGAGAYAHWPQRYLAHEVFGTQLGPKSGAMGYGLPAAIGVQAAQPDRRVVALAGDGCFMMQAEELATAVLYRLPVIVIVINNSSYGAIAASQSRMFGRRSGVALAPVDFAAMATAMGASGIRVTATAQFGPALGRALAAEGPTLIEIITTEEALKP